MEKGQRTVIGVSSTITRCVRYICVKQLVTSMTTFGDAGACDVHQFPYRPPQKTHMPLRSSRGMPYGCSSSLRSRLGVFFFPCAILTFSKYTYLQGFVSIGQEHATAWRTHAA